MGKILLASFVFIGLAAPAATWAGSGGGHFMAPRSFGFQARPQAFARHERRGFAGLGASGAYSTLLSGSFPSAEPEAEPGVIVPPPFCFGMAPPPPRCVRPLLIHLVPPQPAKNLPRVLYGTPFDCAG